MKTYFIAALLLAASTWTVQSQTKGTNSIGFGVSSSTSKYEVDPANAIYNEQKGTNYSLTFGHFVKDNARIGLTATYFEGSSTSTSGGVNSDNKGYGGILHYQKYYPLLKRFYAYAGGRGRYLYSKDRQYYQSSGSNSYKGSTYGIGAYGGAAYFLSKRFAFEAQLLTADFTYYKQTNTLNSAKSTQTNLNISSSGVINDLGFSIYLLF